MGKKMLVEIADKNGKIIPNSRYIVIKTDLQIIWHKIWMTFLVIFAIMGFIWMISWFVN